MVALMLLTAGCVAPPQYIPTEIKRAELNLPMPKPLQLEPFQVVVINKDNESLVIDQTGGGFLLTADEYDTLRLDLQSMQDQMVRLMDIINQQKNYYETPNPIDANPPTK